MPDLIRYPETGGRSAWIPVYTGMTDGYTESEFALARHPSREGIEKKLPSRDVCCT